MREIFLNQEDSGISPVVGVILIIAITIILAALIGLMALGFGDTLSEVGTENQNAFETSGNTVTPIKMGSEEVKIKVNGVESATISAGQVGSSITLNADDGDTVSIVDPQTNTVIKEWTVQEENMNYKNASNLEKSDLDLVNKTSYYYGAEDRIKGTEENLEVSVPEGYNPDELSYTWKKSCYDSDTCYATWSATITSDSNTATYKYTSIGDNDWNNKGKATAKVIVELPDGTTYTYENNYYKVYEPIQTVSFESEESYYYGTNDRIEGTNENWSISGITLHSKVSDVLGSDTPSSLSDYDYGSWEMYCIGTYDDDDKNCYSSWDANIDGNYGNNYESTYEYTSAGNNDYGDGKAAPEIPISIPGIDNTQNFWPSTYKAYEPMQSVSFSGNMSGETRNVSDIESWEVSSVNLHSQVSNILGSDTPDSRSDYEYSNWGRNCAGTGCHSSWDANIDGNYGNNYESTYEYTRAGDNNYNAGKASPKVTIKVPGISTTQTETPNGYYVYE